MAYRATATLTSPEFLWPLALFSALAAIAVVLLAWWIRERRLEEQRRCTRGFQALTEEVIAAASANEIAETLTKVIPAITCGSVVHLYLFNRRTKSLDRVPTTAEPEPMSVAVDSPLHGLLGGAVGAFRNRTLLNVPDVRRSPFVTSQQETGIPLSAIFLPLFAQQEVLGVLEVGNTERLRPFTLEEQSAAQHLANQIAASIKLQGQHAVREQLFQCEKRAATARLMADVATELRAPLDSIIRLSATLSSFENRPASGKELADLTEASKRTMEIVNRLMTFASPSENLLESGPLNVNALLAGLVRAQGSEWRDAGLQLDETISAEPAFINADRSELERVLQELLTHAAQSAVDAPEQTLSISSRRSSKHQLIEISYSQPPSSAPENPFAVLSTSEAAGLPLLRELLQNQGGEVRFRSTADSAAFEIELPLALPVDNTNEVVPVRKSLRSLTVMFIDLETGNQMPLLSLFHKRGHRVVPVRKEEAVELAQRLRFDVVFRTLRPGTWDWSDLQDELRPHIPSFVLMTDGSDARLARVVENVGGFQLGQPLDVAELDRILQAIETRSAKASATK